MQKSTQMELMFQIHHSANLMHRGHPRGPVRAEGAPAMRGQGRVLALLVEHDGAPLKDLVELMDIRPSSLSELVAKLEAQGLVERREDEGDRRSVRVFLTQEGRAQATAALDAREQTLSALFAGLNEDEQQQLLALLTKMNAALEQRLSEMGEDPHRCPHGRECGFGPHGPQERCGGRHRGPRDPDGPQGRGPRRPHHGPFGPMGGMMQGWGWGDQEGPEEIIDME